jgi:gliding motility-associated-like protein
MLRLSLCFCIFPLFVLGQSPAIRYATPQIYILDRNIAPLVPENTGGLVQAVNHNEVITFAGSGAAGGKDGRGILATFQNPSAIETDDNGNLYVTDSYRSTIRKITPEGEVTTIAGGGSSSFANGNGKNAYFAAPWGVVRDKLGNLFVSDANNGQIRKITPEADVTTFAGSLNRGNTDGPGLTATFYHLAGIAIDRSENMYIADRGNYLIRKITREGIVSTFAGNGTKGESDGPALSSSFNMPIALAIDDAGNIYVSDYYGHVIRKISNGFVTTLAGNGIEGYANGNALQASFKNPWGLATDRAGNIYVTDYSNHLIRKIGPNGNVTTLAGSITAGSADGTLASATFNNPIGIAVDKFENIYIADFLNNKIRRITLGGYTIDKSLPEGLVFDPKTGIITGTPKQSWPSTTYTITGYNVFGSSTASLTIEVNESLAAAAKIPGAFSPNGDGVNDSWAIKGLQNDPQCKVLVFNRNGAMVFESNTGYTRPWDGRYQGRDLPVGVYFYLLNLSNGQKKSGAVMLLK